MPTFVLIRGGFCRGRVRAETAAVLEADGHPVQVIDLPGSRTRAAEPGDPQADITAVRRVLDRIGAEIISSGTLLTEFAGHWAVQHSVYLTARWPLKGATGHRPARLGLGGRRRCESGSCR